MTLVWILAIWLGMFGLNILIRTWHLRSHQAKNTVLAVIKVRGDRPKWRVPSLIRMFLVLLLAAAIGEGDSATLLRSVLIASAVLAVHMLYWRSETRRADVLVFDREGASVYPARLGRVDQGTFETRVEWQDVFGYSVYKGNLMFSLRPCGYIEQVYGTERESIEQVLNGLGVRKVIAYDVIYLDETDEERLEDLANYVEQFARDVIAGYSTDLARHGLRLDLQRLHHHPDNRIEGRSELGDYMFLQVRFLEGESVLQEFEWLIWEKFEDVVELVALSDDRLYELFDDRLQQSIDEQMRARGESPRKTVLN